MASRLAGTSLSIIPYGVKRSVTEFRAPSESSSRRATARWEGVGCGPRRAEGEAGLGEVPAGRVYEARRKGVKWVDLTGCANQRFA